AVGVPDDRLGRRPDDQLLLQLRLGIHLDFAGVGLQPVVRDDGALLGEALGHLLFALKEALGDEQREIGVDGAGRLEGAVEAALHVLPEGVAVGFDDHTAADVGILGQPGAVDDVLIPLRVVGGSAGDRLLVLLGGLLLPALFLLGHAALRKRPRARR